MSYQHNGPKYGPSHGPKFVNATAAITTDSVTERLGSFLRNRYGGSAKLVARDAGCNIEAARNWLDGRNTMSLTYFLRLCQSQPDLWGEARRIIAMDVDLDPDTEAALLKLMMAMSRRRSQNVIAAAETPDPEKGGGL